MVLYIGGRDIQNSEVKCFNSERGCNWTGTIKKIDSHTATCEYVLVTCPNLCEDSGGGKKKIMKKDQDKHLTTECEKRLYYCKYCRMKGTFFSITKEHDIMCDKKLVNCPNWRSGCPLFVEKGKTKQHVSVCEFTEVACAYESLGCGVRMMRKDIEKHEASVSVAHFQMMDKIVKLQSEMLREQSKSLHLLENECQKVSQQHQDLLQNYNKFSLKYKTLSEKHSKLFPVVKLLSERAMSMSKHHFTLLEGESIQFKLSQYASKEEKK